MKQQIQAPAAQSSAPPLRVLRLPEVIQKTGLARTTLYMMSRDGKFPVSISLGGKAMGWIESEIDQWIAELMAARKPKPTEN